MAFPLTAGDILEARVIGLTFSQFVLNRFDLAVITQGTATSQDVLTRVMQDWAAFVAIHLGMAYAAVNVELRILTDVIIPPPPLRPRPRRVYGSQDSALPIAGMNGQVAGGSAPDYVTLNVARRTNNPAKFFRGHAEFSPLPKVDMTQADENVINPVAQGNWQNDLTSMFTVDRPTTNGGVVHHVVMSDTLQARAALPHPAPLNNARSILTVAVKQLLGSNIHRKRKQRLT